MRNWLCIAGIVLVSVAAGPKHAFAQQAGQPAMADRGVQPGAPFVLSAQEQAALDQLLLAWQQQSVATKRLQAKFHRWTFDPVAAPLGIHSKWAEGMIKYVAPDAGLFRVDVLKFYSGMEDEHPTYQEIPGGFGEYWICNGKEVKEFDRKEKQCIVRQLPPELQGKDIFDSPLPFVFNLDAAKIKQRYWIKQVPGPQGFVVIDAHPKFQADRAQYKFVRIALNQQTFLPQALMLYAPNFDEQKNPVYDHYEFSDVERNTLGGGIADVFGKFINEQPPSDWKVIREAYQPMVPEQPQMAQPNVGNPALR